MVEMQYVEGENLTPYVQTLKSQFQKAVGLPWVGNSEAQPNPSVVQIKLGASCEQTAMSISCSNQI